MAQTRKRYSDLDFSEVAPESDSVEVLVAKLGAALHQRDAIWDLLETQQGDSRTHCQHQILVYNAFMIGLCLRIERLLNIPTAFLCKINQRYARIMRFAAVEATIHDQYDVASALRAIVEDITPCK